MAYPYAEWRYSNEGLEDRFKVRDDEYLYDEPRADRVIEFLEGACILSTGRRNNKPLELLEWQKLVIKRLFGTIRWSDLDERYVRQYTDCDIWIPRKNGKTTLIAGIGLYLTAKEEHLNGRAYVVAVAGTMKQAQQIFRQAKGFIGKNEILKKTFNVRNFPHGEIEHIKTGGILKVIASDGDTALGSEPTAVLFDEIAIQKNSILIDALAGGQGSIPEPLFISISTAGYKNTHKFGYELWSRSKAVFDKQSEDKYRLVFMKPLADDANWEDEQVWKFANPSLGIGTSLDFLRRKYNECLQMPAKIPHFKAYFLNIWSDSESLWIDDKAWSESGHAGGQFTDDQLAGRSCYGGLDVASTSDLSSWVLLFPGTPDDPAADGYTVLVRTWGTASSVERRDDHFKDKLKYWAKDGWIDLSAETRISHEAIKEQIKADSEKFNIILAGYDKWNSHGIEEDVSKTGITMIDVIQSTKVLDQSRKEMHLLVKEKKLYHGFNPVLAWNVSNVVATVNNLDQVEIVKGKSKDKIDAVAATINAVYVSAYKPEDKRARTMFIPMRGDRT